MERACFSSGEISSSNVVTAGPTLVWAITLRSGTSASKVELRDGGSGGTLLWAISFAATTIVGDVTVSKTFAKPLIFSTSCYATLAGTGALAYVAYEVVS